MEIIPIHYAESFLTENEIFYNGSENIKHKIVFKVYVVKIHNRTILIDTGCESMPGFDMKNFKSPILIMKNLGINTKDVTDVIITHAHHDHIECARYFNNSVIHIEKNELREAKEYLSDNLNVNVFSNEYLVCDNVKIIKIGGHSPGSCIVEVKNNGKNYVFAGDECYLRDCLEKKIYTGNSYCPEKSKKFIEKYSKSDYEIFLCHDI